MILVAEKQGGILQLSATCKGSFYVRGPRYMLIFTMSAFCFSWIIKKSVTSMIGMLYPLSLLSIPRQELDNFCLPDMLVT